MEKKEKKLNLFKVSIRAFIILSCILHLIYPEAPFIQGLCQGIFYLLIIYVFIDLLGVCIFIFFKDTIKTECPKEYLEDLLNTSQETIYTAISFIIIATLFMLNGFYNCVSLCILSKILCLVLKKELNDTLK